jgi:hypothetical protein
VVLVGGAVVDELEAAAAAGRVVPGDSVVDVPGWLDVVVGAVVTEVGSVVVIRCVVVVISWVVGPRRRQGDPPPGPGPAPHAAPSVHPCRRRTADTSGAS